VSDKPKSQKIPLIFYRTAMSGESAHLPARRLPGGASRIHQKSPHNAGSGTADRPQTPQGARSMTSKRMGSSVDDFLKQEGIFEQAQAQAIKEVVARRLAEAMKTQNVSKRRMAALLQTSRTQVDRLLDPQNDITLSSLQRAAAILGRRVHIELV
jgi:predicted XRE-type DNA-binding protein